MKPELQALYDTHGALLYVEWDYASTEPKPLTPERSQSTKFLAAVAKAGLTMTMVRVCEGVWMVPATPVMLGLRDQLTKEKGPS